ncbi:MAG: NAD(P)-binding domain-containing protein [Proteiniphilum sp.]|uniref:NADPH-dependent F420 reductase n=1 Tax=Proteiniphilum sp. TaxID=1926877 RepID=UPI002B21CDEE|nr:NAD(P)-binding domain-containing protein [Proteiniphilum sp.]MEA5128245.1 NAD(P)-binding domain-containing protein [Proteiniphilum sp.]
MNIGIIGAGNIGGTLARRLSQLNHNVTIANSREPETLKELATEINVKTGTVYDVARNNDIVVITIPQKNILNLPKDLFDGVKDDMIIIDTCNYYPLLRDGVIDELEQDLTNSEWVQTKIQRPVVKAFNSIAFTSLANASRPKGDNNRIALPVSGDREKDKEVVSDLLNQLGFDSFDVGELKNSWKYEPGTPTYCMDFNLETLKRKLNELGMVRTPEIRTNINSRRTAQEKQILEYFAQQKP